MRTQIQAQQALTDYTRRHARRIITGDLGNNAGVVDHPSRTNYVYVHLHGDDNQIIEAEAIVSFPHVAGVVVAVEELKRTGTSRWQVLGLASNIVYPNSIWAGTVGEHAAQHQRRDFATGGFDPLDVYTRALVNLRARAQATPDMTLYVERGLYFISGVLTEWTGGNSPAFTAPAGSPMLVTRRCDLLYIGDDDALHIVQGTVTTDGSLPPYPTTPIPCVPVIYVYLSSNTTSITESYLRDARLVASAIDLTLDRAVCHSDSVICHNDEIVYL